jgi:hypothetical protein
MIIQGSNNDSNPGASVDLVACLEYAQEVLAPLVYGGGILGESEVLMRSAEVVVVNGGSTNGSIL